LTEISIQKKKIMTKVKVMDFDDCEMSHDIEKDVVSDENIENVDIRINPDFYIHNAIVKAQGCLIKEDMRSGMVQFRILIEHIESLCKAAGKVAQDYEKKIAEFEASTANEKDSLIRQTLIANKKLELLMQEAFSSKILTQPLSDKEFRIRTEKITEPPAAEEPKQDKSDF